MGFNFSSRTFAIIADKGKGGRGGKGGVAEPWCMLPHLVISCIALYRKAAKLQCKCISLVSCVLFGDGAALHCIGGGEGVKKDQKCALLHQPGSKVLC